MKAIRMDDKNCIVWYNEHKWRSRRAARLANKEASSAHEGMLSVFPDNEPPELEPWQKKLAAVKENLK